MVFGLVIFSKFDKTTTQTSSSHLTTHQVASVGRYTDFLTFLFWLSVFRTFFSCAHTTTQTSSSHLTTHQVASVGRYTDFLTFLFWLSVFRTFFSCAHTTTQTSSSHLTTHQVASTFKQFRGLIRGLSVYFVYISWS